MDTEREFDIAKLEILEENEELEEMWRKHRAGSRHQEEEMQWQDQPREPSKQGI